MIEVANSLWSAALTVSAPAGAIDPTSLGLHLWLDVSDITTLYKDVAGTSPVTADGDLVARINNKGSAGGNFMQATSGARPVYKAGAGKPYLQFDGVDDVLEGTMVWSAVYGSTAFEAVLAAYHTAITSDAATTVPYSNQSIIGDASGYNSLGLGKSSAGVGLGGRDGGAGFPYVSLFSAYTAGTPYVHAGRLDAGTLYSRLNSGTDQTAAFASNFALTGLLRLGANFGATYTNGRLHAAYIRKTVFTTQQRSDLIALAASKNGAAL